MCGLSAVGLAINPYVCFGDAGAAPAVDAALPVADASISTNFCCAASSVADAVAGLAAVDPVVPVGVVPPPAVPVVPCVSAELDGAARRQPVTTVLLAVSV